MDDEDRPSAKKHKKAPKPLSEKYLYNSALYYLQRHPTSEAHFLSVMTRKITRAARAQGLEDTGDWKNILADKVLPQMRAAGLLNDELYGQALTRSLQSKGMARNAISQRLKMKGITADTELLAVQDDMEAAMIHARRKRLGPFARVAEDDDAKRKSLASLARAGFSYETAMKVIKQGRSGDDL